MIKSVRIESEQVHSLPILEPDVADNHLSDSDIGSNDVL